MVVSGRLDASPLRPTSPAPTLTVPTDVTFDVSRRTTLRMRFRLVDAAAPTRIALFEAGGAPGLGFELDLDDASATAGLFINREGVRDAAADFDEAELAAGGVYALELVFEGRTATLELRDGSYDGTLLASASRGFLQTEVDAIDGGTDVRLSVDDDTAAGTVYVLEVMQLFR